MNIFGIINRDGKKEHYTLQETREGKRYVRKDGRPLPERPLQILASHTADGEPHVFKPKTDEKGNLKTEKNQACAITRRATQRGTWTVDWPNPHLSLWLVADGR